MTSQPQQDPSSHMLAKDWISLLLSLFNLKNAEPSAILHAGRGSNFEVVSRKRLLWHCWVISQSRTLTQNEEAEGQEPGDTALAWLLLLAPGARSTVLREIRRKLDLPELQEASNLLGLASVIRPHLQPHHVHAAIEAGWMSRGTCQAGSWREARRLQQESRVWSRSWLQSVQEPPP